MSTQEDILLPRAQRKRMRMQVSDARPVQQADMTYVSDTGDPNDAVRQGVYDNTQQRIEAMKGAQGNPQTIDVQGKGLVPTYGQQQVPQGAPLPTAAPNPSQAQVTPQQLVNSKTGVVSVPKATPIPVQGKVTEQKKPLTYDDVLALMGKQKEDDEKRIRREKRSNLIAAIGNGLSALSNLYYTTKGAPSAFTPELSARMRARYDELEKERTANDKAYLNTYLTILEKQRNDARIRERNEITNNYYKTKGELEGKKQAGELELKRQQQEFAQQHAQDKLEETKRNNKAMEQNAQQRVNAYIQKYGGTGKNGDGTTNYWVYGPDGKKHYFKNKSQRDVYAIELAMNNKDGDTPITEDKIVTTETSDGYGGTKTNKRTSKEKLSGDRITANVNNKYKPNPKGSTSGKTIVNW